MQRIPGTSLELHSTIRSDGTLRLSLDPVPVPEPGPDEVILQMEAAPLNPSDLHLLFGAADMARATQGGTTSRPVVTAPVPAERMAEMAARIDQPHPVGNEGAGTVMAAGRNPVAQAMLGRTVAVLGAGAYAQWRCVAASQCLVLPPGLTALQGASSFINPHTVLGMVHTMRREGHSALVHTAAASNLGQMLIRACAEDAIPLVNIVRGNDQVQRLRAIGATHICDTMVPAFDGQLHEALDSTGATLGFDALGGGTLAGAILRAMEHVAAKRLSSFSRYGSNVRKQVYVYGKLVDAPLEVPTGLGFAWSMGGWLLTPFLESIGPEARQRMRERILAGLQTTFASSYGAQIPLAAALHLDNLRRYARRESGSKIVLNLRAHN